MKFVKKVKCTNNEIALEFKDFFTPYEKEAINSWAKAANIGEYIDPSMYYSPEMFGDIDYPAILVKPGAPKGTVELCILKWGNT